MKLAFAVACLAATLAVAGNAFADGRTVATLQGPVLTKAEFVADTGVWRCDGAACIASYTGDQSFGVSQCRDVAKRAKVPVTDFTDADGHKLNADQLARCNAGIAPVASTVAAAH